MKIEELHNLDNKLKILAGLPIKIKDFCVIKPYTLREIAEVGYTEFATMLNSLTIDVHRIIENPPKDIELNLFDVYSFIGDQNFKDSFIKSLVYFLRLDKFVTHKIENGIDIIVVGVDSIDEDTVLDGNVYVIHRDNFPLISEVLKLQNGLKSFGSFKADGYRASNDKAKEILARLNKSKETVSKIKKNQGASSSDIDIFDIISAVSTKSNTDSKVSVWDLTLFQLYDEYKRLQMIDQYEVNLQAIMNGAEKIELKHWSSKPEEED